jgi:hypothetical protein
MNRLLSTGMPGMHVDHSNSRGAGFVDNPRGNAVQGAQQGPAPIWPKGHVPGVLMMNGPGGGHVGGTSNLSTSGPIPGTAP